VEAIIRKIEALLNTNGCSEAEAEARMAKAQEMLAKYNLDMAEIGKSGKDNQRTDANKKGGLYSWQRKLWKGVAELNFCYYSSIKGLARGAVYEHRVIGSHANVIATDVMARYLQGAIEKLAQQWAKDNLYKSVFVREAIAYREGMASRISERLWDRRDQIVAEERRKAEQRKQEAARNAVDPGTTALTILDVISTESDFNTDYLNGWELGTTARNRAAAEARSAAWHREYAEKARAQAEWDKANPEAAAARKKAEDEELAKWVEENRKREAARQKRANKTSPKPRYRKMTAEEQRANLDSFWEGRSKGNEVGIDTQIDENAKRKAIG